MPSIQLFGGFQLNRDGMPPEVKKSRRADSLIAFLAVNLGKKYQRDLLVSTLCADMAKPSDGFRTILKFARDALGESLTTGEAFLYADKTQIWLNAAADLTVDVAVFSRPSPLPPNLPIDQLANLALLYRGPFLEGYEVEEYNMVWVSAERTRLETRFNQIMKMLVDQLLQAQRWNDVLEWSEHWLRYTHLPEDAYAALMMAYTGLKDFAKLMDTLDRYEREMTEGELPISDAILNLHKRLTSELSKKRTVTVDTQAVFAPNRPRPLPHQTTTFVGRQEHLRVIYEELADPHCRLLSLIGFGGVGKTRLALQAGLQSEVIALFPDGIAFVEMARVKSSESFFAALSDALNFSPYGQESLPTQLANYLREKAILLILDAFEHALELDGVDDGAGGAGDAGGTIDSAGFDLVSTLEQHLLTTAPKLKILATSRRRLRAADERVIDLEGLDYPGRPGSTQKPAGDYDAVRLFLQIARNRKRDFDVPSALADVVRICQMVQGMPLAIGLAAAQIRFFPCKTIADELTRSIDVLETDDPLAEPRQRTVRAAFEYAWMQLDHIEQTVFRNLAVFPGSFSLDAARYVTGAQMKVLRSLVDWSLLQLDGTRYQLHDLLRQFGGEKLSQSSELDAYERFVRFFAEFAQAKQRDYAALEPEWGNLLAGMRFARDGHRWRTVIDYALHLGEAWFTRGRFTEMRMGMQWACEGATTLHDEAALADCLRHHGRACIEQGAYDEAFEHLLQSQALCEKANDLSGTARSKFNLARIAIEQANYPLAEQLLADAEQVQTQLNDLNELGQVLYQQAWMQHLNAQYIQAEAIAQRALEIQISSGDQLGQIRTLRQLAESISISGNHVRALSYCEDALKLCEIVQDQIELALVLYTLSQICRRIEDFDRARQCAKQGLSLLDAMGNRKSQAHLLLQLGLIEEAQRQYQLALEASQQSLGLFQSLGDEWGMVYSLEQAGVAFKNLGQTQQAKIAWVDALRIATKMKHPYVDLLNQHMGAID